MKRFTVIHTRPSPDIPFCEPPPELMEPVDPYLASGALVSKEIRMTALTKIWINTWRSAEDAQAFTAHPKSAPRHEFINQYNERMGITKQLIVENL